MIAADSFLLLSASLVEPAAGSRQLTASAACCALPAAGYVDHWRGGDIPRAAALLHDAYPRDIGRHFAPGGTAAEWLRYVTALVTQTPCGAFHADWSRVVRDGDAMRAVAMVTFLAPATAHLAQLAVSADSRRSGLATCLVREAAAAAAAAGCERLTLLVAVSNAPARRLYESLGFTPDR